MLSVAVAVRVAGEAVEQVGDVRGEHWIAREQTDVLVHRCRCWVVVPGADMAVTADRVALTPYEEDGLGMRLQPDDAVDDVDAGLLEGPRPGDVRLLVAPSRQLDEGDHLLAGLGRAHERAHDRGLALVGRAVERLLDREDVGIVGRLVDERLDRGRESVVRVLHEHLLRAESREDVTGSSHRAAELGRRHASPWLRRESRAPQLGQRPEIAEV